MEGKVTSKAFLVFQRSDSIHRYRVPCLELTNLLCKDAHHNNIESLNLCFVSSLGAFPEPFLLPRKHWRSEIKWKKLMSTFTRTTQTKVRSLYLLVLASMEIKTEYLCVRLVNPQMIDVVKMEWKFFFRIQFELRRACDGSEEISRSKLADYRRNLSLAIFCLLIKNYEKFSA